MTTGMMIQFRKQNLNITNVIAKIQRQTVIWNTRGTVTVVMYRKCRVNARSWSTETKLRVTIDTPAVVQLDMVWIILKTQYTLKLLPSSAILYATKNGWQISPTRRSEAARQNKRKNDGEWSSRVFQTTYRITEFPIHVIRENTKLRTHVKIFAVCVSPVWSKFMSKKEQVGWVLFILISLADHWLLR